jgi:hypothetical protein
MKFLCNFIELKASKAGTDTSNQSLDNVQKMFDAALKEFIIHQVIATKELTNLDREQCWSAELERN